MTLEKRFQCHCRCSHPEKMLIERAILKYGKQNFKIECIDTANSIEELNGKEIYYIDSMTPIYNTAPGGSGGPLFKGYKHTTEAKEKIRQKKLGKTASDETKYKMRQSSQRTRMHKFINPNGVIEEIYNLEEYCRNNKMHSSGFRKLQAGKINKYKNYRRVPS